MCGITGFWDAGRLSGGLGETVLRMAAAASHRGPDDQGEWTDAGAGVALGHRRLSILDLSPDGHQPMASAGGRYQIVFNGEIYNFAAIRRELEAAGRAPAFRGHSDTEVMLAAIEAWGLVPAVERFVGMFAFALWDRAERVLHLVRDRLGIKPLFYGWSAGALLFGSELSMLRAFPGFDAGIDRDAITLLLRHNCIPAPHSIHRGIRKLPPGTVLSLRSPRESDAPEPVAYWSAGEVAARGVADPFRGTDAEATDALDALLRDAVGLRMIADVPLGAFLSGGIDSSTVVALMQAQSGRPVKTFSIGSPDARADESRHARAVAEHLGTDHTDLIVTERDALEVVPMLATMYDEPFADSSQIPTYLVSRLARREVTVSLSGDGGDELFAGYNRHVWVNAIWRRVGWVPRPVRQAVAAAVLALPQARWEQLFGAMGPVLPPSLRHRWPGAKLHKLAGVAGVRSPEAMYRDLTSHWRDPGSLVVGGSEPATLLSDPRAAAGGLTDVTQRMMLLDLLTYLPDDILTKVDRASMAVSLEARVPLIDHRVVEFAWRLPNRFKLRDGQSKWLLRQVLYRYVPRELIERPKEGFGIPLGPWLRGPLRGWAEALIEPGRMRREGYLDPAPVAAMWAEHLGGRRNWEHHLWDVLMFQSWLEAQSGA
jgi:asparagine synthase (glutamine-hydrolysing)